MRINLNMDAKLIFIAHALKKNLMRVNRLTRFMMLGFLLLSDGVPAPGPWSRALVVPVGFAMLELGPRQNLECRSTRERCGTDARM